jgi:hypothetical protein
VSAWKQRACACMHDRFVRLARTFGAEVRRRGRSSGTAASAVLLLPALPPPALPPLATDEEMDADEGRLARLADRESCAVKGQ